MVTFWNVPNCMVTCNAIFFHYCSQALKMCSSILMKYVYIKAITFYLKRFHPSIAELINKATHNCAYMPHVSKVPHM